MYQRISVRFVGLTLSRVCKGKLCVLGVVAIEVEVEVEVAVVAVVAVVRVVAVEVAVEVEVTVCQHANLVECTGDFREHTRTPTGNSGSMSDQL